jgi:L-fuculokinase
MAEKLTLVLDCGATNVRAVAVNTRGDIVAMHSVHNTTKTDPNYPEGLIWDIDQIWEKFCVCTHKIISQVDVHDIAAITVTTFGVNGAPVDRLGNLLYPVISWQCQRTSPIMEDIEKYVSKSKLYAANGLFNFSFNTIYVLLWLKENRPDVIESMEGFLFISSLFIHKLTGSFINDTTMAGTSMLTDIKTRKFSESLLSAAGLPDKFFTLSEPGTIAGDLLPGIASEMGLSPGIPVVLAGHDTQFALLGSGAIENEVVLSSGTWEILMTRTKNIQLGEKSRIAGITHELDVQQGLYNSGLQWLGSGVLEWIKRNLFKYEMEYSPENIYEIMISEAEEAGPQFGITKIDPSLGANEGSISGIGMHTTRGQIYRAALEALAMKTKESMDLLQQEGNFKAESIIIVGGGSKNMLWNQIRAEILNLPLKINKKTETTVLGAAITSMVSTGIFDTIEQGIKETAQDYQWIYPKGKEQYVVSDK